MAVKVQGLQELVNHLDRIATVGDKYGSQALREAGDVVRKKEVEVVQREHTKYSQDVGYKELKRYPVKTGSRGGKYVNIGIRAGQTASAKKKDAENAKKGVSRATHWDKIKGLIA